MAVVNTNLEMYPALKIEIGSSAFSPKEVSKEVIDKHICNILSTLGIPVEFNVTITNSPDFITVNGHRCYFPDSVIKSVDAYVIFFKKSTHTDLNDELYWEFIISNILWLQPQVLVSDNILPVLMPALNSLPAENFIAIQTHCKEIIIELLNLKISLYDKTLIRDLSNKHLLNQIIDWNAFREELIESLVSPEISIFLNAGYFDQISRSGSKENLFELMRDGLFHITGIKYPPFKIIFDSNLPGNAFQFKINSFTSIPTIGLPDKDEYLVNETCDRLRLLGIEGKPIINPGNGIEASIVNIVDKEKAEKEGLTAWGSLGYFILSFSSFLRTYGYACINKKMIMGYMETLKLIYPKIIELAEKENLLSVFVKTLRLLAKEEISVQNFRVILEAVLASDYIIANAREHIIFDERIPINANAANGWKHKAENIVEFVRIRLKRHISHKYTRGQNTLVVHLLDQEIEKAIYANLDAASIPDTADYKKIMDAFKKEIGDMPASSQPPVILTTVDIRRLIKKMMEISYPQVAVLSYQELSPELNIQPIARISFN